jgi:hypothetical protein
MPLRDLPECEIIRFGKRDIYNFPPAVGPGGPAYKPASPSGASQRSTIIA